MVNIPTIDGLGPIGGLDHGPDEYLDRSWFNFCQRLTVNCFTTRKGETMRKLIVLMMIAGLILSGAQSAIAADTIKIGHPGDFSGVYSFYDSPVRDGALFAIDEINASGGVLGRKLELMARDSRND